MKQEFIEVTFTLKDGLPKPTIDDRIREIDLDLSRLKADINYWFAFICVLLFMILIAIVAS